MIRFVEALLILFFIIVPVALLVDLIASQPDTFHGEVIDKHYEARSHSIGTGVGVTSGGKIGTVMTNEVEPEKFLLMVKTQSGKIVTVRSHPELYYQKLIGDKVEFNAYIGLFSGLVWKNRAVR